MLEQLIGRLFDAFESKETKARNAHRIAEWKEQQARLAARGRQYEEELATAYQLEFNELLYWDGRWAEDTLRSDSAVALHNYVSSLTMLGLYQTMFQESEVSLPESIRALDVGAGSWFYLPALIAFLQKHGSDVKLHGVDILGERHVADVRRRLRFFSNATYEVRDFFDLPSEETFDIVFANHLLDGDLLHAEWKIPYRPPEAVWQKAFSVLKPRGLLLATSYRWSGGNNLIQHIPKNTRLVDELSYDCSITIRGVDPSGLKSFVNNIATLAQKPF